MKVTLDPAGRIQLPPAVQTQLGIKAGDEVLLEYQDGQWVIQAARLPSGLGRKGNVLVHEGTCPRPVDQALDHVREETSPPPMPATSACAWPGP